MKQLALFTCAALAACTGPDHPEVTGPQSLKIDVTSNTGTQDQRLDGADPTDTQVTVNVTALDPDGNLDPTFNNDLQVYVEYLGTLTPYLCDPGSAALCEPLATVHMTNGVAMNQTITLPRVYGPTSVWFDDGDDANATYATGATTTLWYRDPFIRDVQDNEASTFDKFDASPLENKNVQVNGSRHGSDGKLVVTSVFAQGYTVADVLCTGGGPPCTLANDLDTGSGSASGYDTVEVFSFSAPLDDNGNVVYEGEVIDGWAGGVSEFDGLTEIGFPQTFVGTGSAVIDKTLEPPSYVLPTDGTDPSSWFSGDDMINFERAESAALEIDNAVVCPLDSDYTTYKQWKLAPPGSDCSNYKQLINVISEGVIQLDPGVCVGKTLPRVTGMLRPVNIGSFNVWLIYPRSPSDLQLPTGDPLCTLTGSGS